MYSILPSLLTKNAHTFFFALGLLLLTRHPRFLDGKRRVFASKTPYNRFCLDGWGVYTQRIITASNRLKYSVLLSFFILAPACDIFSQVGRNILRIELVCKGGKFLINIHALFVCEVFLCSEFLGIKLNFKSDLFHTDSLLRNLMTAGMIPFFLAVDRPFCISTFDIGLVEVGIRKVAIPHASIVYIGIIEVCARKITAG